MCIPLRSEKYRCLVDCITVYRTSCSMLNISFVFNDGYALTHSALEHLMFRIQAVTVEIYRICYPFFVDSVCKKRFYSFFFSNIKSDKRY